MSEPFAKALSEIPLSLRPVFDRHWQSYLHALQASGQALPTALPPELPAVWMASDFVAEFCIRDPEGFAALLEGEGLDRPLDRAAWRAWADAALAEAAGEAAFMRRLRRFRRQALARIAWRDLAGKADLDEVLASLSWLAEICVEKALRFAEDALQARFGCPRDAMGAPVRLSVLALGKLGGGELNFSSDIDLVFAYAGGAGTGGARALDRQSYFIRLGQTLIRLLAESTEDGFVYRVDMRLRPFGDAGPLAMSYDATEEYYQRHGREWERYALIKARAIAGDIEGGRQLLARLRPFVYRKYLDYGAFSALRELKALIRHEAERKGRLNDVKLSPGGIREVEFIAQVFQLVRGGRDPALQCRRLRETLRRLAERGLLPERVEAQLLAAYECLRRVENRLQMQADQQTHALPADTLARQRLAWSMGFGADWDAFAAQLNRHMRHVHEHFEQVFAAPQAEEDETGQRLRLLWERAEARALSAHLQALGYAQPDESAARLIALRNSRMVQALSPVGRERLQRLMPLLLQAAAGQAMPDVALARALEVVQAVASRSVYLALLVESPLALSQLIKLCAASPWIARRLAAMPLLLDELLDPRSLYAPLDRERLRQALAQALENVAQDDLETVMDRLRQFKETQVLRVAAADITGALPLMQVSDRLTWIAEVILEKVVSLAREDLARRHGQPRLASGREAGFGIIAYGKLGGIEMSYGSDLDLVFLYEGEGLAAETDGERPLEAPVFFARLAQRIVHFLTAFTSAGRLYEVDMRLRPSGASGLLVSSLAAYAAYQAENAWTWEHQALVRARFVAGAPQVGRRFEAVRREVLGRPRDAERLRRDVREMRERMWRELGQSDPALFDLKRDPGGIADIEFLVQYGVLARASQWPDLLAYTDTLRLLERLAGHGFLPSQDAKFLAEAYQTLRDRIHALTLQDAPPRVAAAEFSSLRAEIGRIWRACFETGPQAR